MKKFVSIVVLGLVFCLFLVSGAGVLKSAAAEELGSQEKLVNVTFTTMYHTASWDFPYSDSFFSLPSDQYHHDFARMSLGLTVSAFRDADHPDVQDVNLIKYLEETGFEGIETDTYRTEPEPDSIAYGLATKRIGNTTVLACAVCGGNYGAEWASNLTVGDQERSEGFNDASGKVQAAIQDYLKRHPADTPLKLWITGYSRSAATANLVAADLTDSGMFEDVYAYTFATPSTTRNPFAYPNIFNIMQKDDVVPKVPLSDWGYRRYGTDLYFVSEETDSDCQDVMERAAGIYRDMMGAEMVNNSEIAFQVRTILDYLLMIMPEPAVYKEYLQPLLLDIMTGSEETGGALLVLLEALQRYSLKTDANGEELKALREYLETMVNVYYLKGTLDKWPAEMWDPSFGANNLFHAHTPFEYVAMLFASDDPSELFSDQLDYIRLMIYGTVDAEILDGDKVLKTVLADGTELVDGKEAPYSFPDVVCSKEKILITLPADRSRVVKVTSRSSLPQTITYTGLLYSGESVKAKADDFYSFVMKNGDTATIVTSSNGRAIEPEASDHMEVTKALETIYSPTTAMRLENNRVMHLTISGLVNKLLYIIVFLLVQMIVSIVFAIIRVKKKRKRNVTVAFIWHFVIAAIFAVLEVAMWYFVPIFTIARFIPAVAVCIVIIVYAFKGYRYHKKGLPTFFILSGALVLYEILTSLLIGEYTFNKGLVELIAYAVFMVLAYLLMWRRIGTKKTAALSA